MRCPGQDPRYWTEDFVFEVPCPECGAPVELFKDETRGRCRKCGHRFRNPGIDLRCAEWCALAEKCLGFVPEGELTAPDKRQALAGRLLQELKDCFAGRPERLALTLRTFHFARELVGQEGGEPRVVLAAALLYELATEQAAKQATERPAEQGEEEATEQTAPGAEQIQNVLARAGADAATAARVRRLIESCRPGEALAGQGLDVPAAQGSAAADPGSPAAVVSGEPAAGGPEAQIVGDAVLLARLSVQLSAACAAEVDTAEGPEPSAAEQPAAGQAAGQRNAAQAAAIDRLVAGLATATARQRAQAMTAGPERTSTS